MSYKIVLTTIPVGGRRFVLRTPLVITVGPQFMECESPFLCALPDDIEGFCAAFAATYDGLIDEPDENLTGDAIELRDRLKALVLRVDKEK